MSSSYIRRKHLKSRNGCAKCKERRIKCDENYPEACGPCLKGRYQCSFILYSAPSPVSEPPEPSPAPPNRLLDLELLYNFTAKTAWTLSENEEVQRCFSTTFVELSFHHDFLLDIILALSAFHRFQQYEQPGTSKVRSRSSFLLTAYAHHTSALERFNLNLPNVNASNCHALFACAVLLFMTSLARPRVNDMPGKEHDLSPRVAEWINLIRGIPTILNHPDSMGLLTTGPMAVFFRANANSLNQLEAVVDRQDNEAVLQLENLAAAIRASSNDTTETICCASIQQLRNAFMALDLFDNKMLAFTWPVAISREYMALMDAKCSEALLVLAHYCVLLTATEGRWWVQGWPMYILEAIKPMLEEKWLAWLEWPMKEIYGEAGSVVAQ